MRNLRSILIILLIITAYGRCVADQFGALHTSGSACCQVPCAQADHCGEESEADEAHEIHTDDHSGDSSDPPPSEDSAPCQLCFILSSDSMLQSPALEVPTPVVFELNDIFFGSPLESLPSVADLQLSLETPPSEYPEHPAERRSQHLRSCAKSTPVRGPSIV